MYGKERISGQVRHALERSGFRFTHYHGCFDIAAKRENLLLIKVLLNIDSFQESQAENLKALSSVLDASPILIGVQTRTSKIQDGVVYQRFSIPAVNPKTFENMVGKDIMPVLYSERGGLFMEVDSSALRAAREGSMTQERLAERSGVTKKSIYEHEARDMKALADVAQRIQRILGESVSKPFQFVRFDVESKSPSSETKDVFDKMKRMGFDVSYIEQSPLNIAAKEKVLLLSDVERDRRKMRKDAPALRGLSRLMRSPAVLITENAKSENIDGVPVVSKDELKHAKKTKDILKIVKERR